MTSSNSHINGASLEDCHTNFFALTNLSGIKWRSYRIEHVVTPEPLDDPVIFSFSKCVAHDVLAVWRRVQQSRRVPSPDPTLAAVLAGSQTHSTAHHSTVVTYKELWIFWYGDEPEFHNLLAPQLYDKRLDDGSWEVGLPYECRALLFKALHKFIERCLLSRGFVKLGRWFTQPFNNVTRSAKKESSGGGSCNLSFAFSFFVHGESTVCASLQLKQAAPLHRLNNTHLSLAAASCQPTVATAPASALAAAGVSGGVPVVLSPYGLSAVLTGNTVRLASPAGRRLVDTWRQLYPLDSRLAGSTLNSSREPLLPAIVEVLVGDVRMKYPSSYVLVCESDLSACSASSSCLSPRSGPVGGDMNGMTARSSPLTSAFVSSNTDEHADSSGSPGRSRRPSSSSSYAEESCPPLLASTHPLLAACSDSARRLSDAVPTRALQQAAVECALSPGGLSARLVLTSACDTTPDQLGHWQFRDPALKSSCACDGCKRKLRHKQQWAQRSDKERAPRIKVGTWHRRAAVLAAVDARLAAGSTSAGPLAGGGGGGGTTPQHVGLLKSGGGSGGGRTGLTPAYYKTTQHSYCADSPASTGPSPLTAPLSQCGGLTASGAGQHADAGVLCSPHPHTPASCGVMSATPRTPAAVSGEGPASVSAATPTAVYSPYVRTSVGSVGMASSPLAPAPRSMEPADTTTATSLSSSCSINAGASSTTAAGQQTESLLLPLPPRLPSPEQLSDTDTIDSSNLYNFSELSVWMDCHVKKGSDIESLLTRRLNEQTPSIPDVAMSDFSNMVSEETFSRGIKRSADSLLEYDNEEAATAALLAGSDCKKSSRHAVDYCRPSPHVETAVKREPGSMSAAAADSEAATSTAANRGNTSGSLFTSAGLEPKLADLENLFDDHDSDTDNNAAAAAAAAAAAVAATVSTPPGSNKPAGACSEESSLSGSVAGGTARLMTGGAATSHTATANTFSQTLMSAKSSGLVSSAPTTLSNIELSKIYPTPPSHEHNHNPGASPLCPPDHLSMDTVDSVLMTTSCVAVKNEPISSAVTAACIVASSTASSTVPCGLGSTGSAHDTACAVSSDADAWCVYRVDPVCRLVGACKYAPLDSLPSDKLPPVLLPDSAVYKPSWQTNAGSANMATSTSSGSTASATVAASKATISCVKTSAMSTPIAGRWANNTAYPGVKSVPVGASSGGAMSQSMMCLSGMLTPCRVGMSPVYDNPCSMKSVGPGSVGPRSVGALPLESPSPCSPYVSRASSAALLHPAPVSVSAGVGAAVAHLPEISALLVNTLLEDSMLNMFHDHNFDSCTMCVCNDGVGHVGNIRGRESALYIPGGGGGSKQQRMSGISGGATVTEDPVSCRCGYSAVVNRRLAFRSGLFVEDEVDLTGERCEVQYEPQASSLASLLRAGSVSSSGPLLDSVGPDLLTLIQQRCLSLPCDVSVLSSLSSHLHHHNQQLSSALNSSVTKLSPHHHLYHHPHHHHHNYRHQHQQQQHQHRLQQQQQQQQGNHLSFMEFNDATDVVRSAVDLLRTSALAAAAAASNAAPYPTCALLSPHVVEQRQRWPMHQWPFVRAPAPYCSQDVVRVMRLLLPHLQNAIQKKRNTKLWESTYQVSGPLTWRQFHRLAGRGTDDHCSPQPVPALLVGHEGEWVATSPFSLHHWETLQLEPVSAPRDVAYLVVTPAGDNEFIVNQVRLFFRELSSSYEACNLGKHVPIGSSCPEGVLRINRNAAVKLANLSVDEWFSHLGESQMAAKLKLYAQYCLHYVGPYLQTSMEISSQRERPACSPMPPPSCITPDSASGVKQSEDDMHSAGAPDYGSSSSSCQSGGSSSASGGGGGGATAGGTDYKHQRLPQMVVYFVDPFSYGAETGHLDRLVHLALMRAYLHMRSTLPQPLQHNIEMQVVSLHSILSACRDVDQTEHRARLRSMAVSVFTQCCAASSQHRPANSLTGFGPSALADQILSNKQACMPSASSAWLDEPPTCRSALCLLAPLPDAQREAEVLTAPAELTRTLFCAYCLSADQNWLLVSCTDACGRLRRTTAINVCVPNRLRRKRVSARQLGLQKLMDWLLGVMVQSLHPWRLVIGRLGRIGHGELRSWSSLLSRKSLTRFTNRLKSLCERCSCVSSAADAVSVLSACLVSLEPDPTHRVLVDQCCPDDTASSTPPLKLSTPHDVTCTHIMVFPTSATTQCAQSAFQQEPINSLDTGFDDGFLPGIDPDDDDAGLPDNLLDGFNWDLFPSSGLDGDRGVGGGGAGDSLSGGAGKLAGSAGPGECGDEDLFGGGGLADSGDSGGGMVDDDGRGWVLQQPLALGYMPSTAGIGHVMPDWFWRNSTNCTQPPPSTSSTSSSATAGSSRSSATTRRTCHDSCVFLRSALHLHCPTHTQDDVLHHNNNQQQQQQQQAHARRHPLDSGKTTDVLRYVLENYSRLSWLAMDPVSRDRRSCLPVHIQLLVQLYSGMAAVV